MGPKKLTVVLMYRKTDRAIFSVLENVLVEWKNKAVKAFNLVLFFNLYYLQRE